MIGKGAFGCVHLATSNKHNSRSSLFPPLMAVKSADFSMSASLQKEKEVLLNLSHCSNVLRCYGEETTVDPDGSMAYNVLLEYASGGTLARLIKNSYPSPGLPEALVKRYAYSILAGIFQVHESGYVHCDLKPDNILLVPSSASSSEFVAKIADFGLAKRATLTKKQKLDPYLRGTAMYLAPESVNEHKQHPPSDIWALGCIVLEMLTGKDPWDVKPDHKRKDLLRLIGDQYQSPTIPSGISKDARAFLKACLVRNPNFRLTAEMLLDHPFVAGQDDHQPLEVQQADQVSNIERISTSYSSFESGDEFDSDDCGSESEEEDSELLSCSSSGSEDVEDSGSTSSFEDGESAGGRRRRRRKRRVSNFIPITDADSLLNAKPIAPPTVPTIPSRV